MSSHGHEHSGHLDATGRDGTDDGDDDPWDFGGRGSTRCCSTATSTRRSSARR